MFTTGNTTVSGDTFTFESANADDPLFLIKNTTNDDQASRLQFQKLRADDAVATGQNLGEIWFTGQNGQAAAGATEELEDYAYIIGEIDVSTNGQESGQLVLGVASHDGGNNQGVKLTGGSVDNEVDVTIGAGAASVTTVSGTLTMGSTATLDNSGLLQVAKQTGITGVGTISSGVWRGSSISTIYTDAKVTSIAAGDGIDVDSSTGEVTISAETATDSNPGVVELATDAEAVTATDTARAVTPANLKARVSQIVNIKGYITLQNDVYDYANPYVTDDEAPFQLDKDYGSGTINSSTEVQQSSMFRSNGFHVPFACTVSALQVQASVNGSGGGNIVAALVEYRPSTASGDTNDYPRTVYEEVTVASNNNNNKVATTTIAAADLDATAVPAGSHLMLMVKGDSTTAGDLAVGSMSRGLSW